MKLDLRRKNLMKIAALTSMMVFTLFSVFSGAIAWFTSVKNLSNGGDNMKVGIRYDVVSKISFHAQVGTKAVTEQDETKNYYLFEKADYASIVITDNIAGNLTFNHDSGAYKDWEAKTDKTSTLATYSLLAQDHPILILFDLVSYTAEDPREVKIDFSTESDYLGFSNTITQADNPLSSIVQFHSFGLTSALPSGGAYESMTQSYPDTYLYGVERQIDYDKKWATVDDEDTATFDDDGVINLFSNLDNSGNPSTTVYTQIGVVMNYSISSLEYIYNKFLGNPILDNNLFFTWDWTMEM